MSVSCGCLAATALTLRLNPQVSLSQTGLQRRYRYLVATARIYGQTLRHTPFKWAAVFAQLVLAIDGRPAASSAPNPLTTFPTSGKKFMYIFL